MLFRLFHRHTPEPSAREVRDEWLQWLALGGARDATVKGYRLTTNRLLDRYPALTFSEFTDEHILAVIEEANPASRQARRSAFANWFGWGFHAKRLTFNPMHHVPNYKQPPQQPVEVFTEAECAILCALPEPDGTLMALLLGSGIRKSEACNLSVRRVDLENGELHVVEGAKGGHAGIVPLESRLVSRLAGYFLIEGLNDGDFVWYTHPGGSVERSHARPLSGGSMHNWWRRCAETAGVPYRNLHTTRHTYATAWRRRGLMLDDVAILLRHADIKTTKRVYDHTSIYDVRRRMEALT